MQKNYVASLSCGKDSLAMVLRLMEEHKPLTHCVMFDTGMEFNAIYNILNKIKPKLEAYGCHLEIIQPNTHYLVDMLLRPVNKGKKNQHYGYDWCGGVCRWRTTDKISKIQAYLDTLGDYVQYIGIAADEPKRVKMENNKLYPLIDWNMSEADCLKFCYDRGWNWKEGEVDLYDILDRVSCWCCANKNLKELRNMYHFLPSYWELLKGLQSRIDRPFRRNGETIFDLERRFILEDSQMNIFDFSMINLSNEKTP